jgi:23S rRNA (adenine2503-C2)-methyltransferase
MQKYTLPTGYLIVDDYSKGKLETLSIGDYGKHVNVKADFLGYTKEINGVPNTECMPLSEKWVITLSTQYGCPMHCTFCDVPNIKFGGNADRVDLWEQLWNAFKCFPNVKYVERLNIHFARMGEPIFNEAVFDFARNLYHSKSLIQKTTGIRLETVHPVLTTSLPKYKNLKSRIVEWCDIKNITYNGQAGLQFSINSTNEEQRIKMFGGGSITLKEFAKIAEHLPDPIGRKYCLNFAYASDFEVDGKLLAKMFDPEKFMAKITPIHRNNACQANQIQTIDGYSSYHPYKVPEESLKEAGFDVLVFVPSMDEEDGLVTCGNAVLGGGKLKVETITPKIKS